MSRVTNIPLPDFDGEKPTALLDTSLGGRPGYSPSTHVDYVEPEKKEELITLTMWEKNGDHPQDGPLSNPEKYDRTAEGRIVRYFRHPGVNGIDFCPLCKNVYHNHGFVENAVDTRGLKYPGIVCPGTVIQDLPDGRYKILSIDELAALGSDVPEKK